MILGNKRRRNIKSVASTVTTPSPSESVVTPPSSSSSSSPSSPSSSSLPNSSSLRDCETLPVISSFIDTYGLVQCQIDPYNDFIERGLHEVVNYFKFTEEGGSKIEFGEVIIENPTVSKLSDNVVKKMTPMYCQEKGYSYLSDVYVDITVTNTLNIPRLYRHVHIGSIPVMVMSNLCNLKDIACDKKEMARLKEDINEKGGYFVVNGSRKIVSCQKRGACNRASVYDKKKQGLPFEYFATIRSALQDGYMSTESFVGYKSGLVYVTIPYIDGIGIPLGILFRALGVTSEKMMVKLSLRNEHDREAMTILVRSLEHSYECDSQDMALEYIGRRGKKWSTTKTSSAKPKPKAASSTDVVDDTNGDGEETKSDFMKATKPEAISYARYLLSTEFLPHLGNTPASFYKKMIFTGYMVNLLIQTILKRRKADDRDHFSNTRIATPGVLFKELWYSAMKSFRKDIVSYLKGKKEREQSAINIHAICKPQTIKNIMCGALSANLWSGKKKVNGRSQTYEQYNYTAGIANARKVVTPMNDDGGKVEKPRHIHLSQMFKTCPAESPEGKKVGLVSGISLACVVSTGFPARDIIPFIIAPENESFVCPIEDIFTPCDGGDDCDDGDVEISYFFRETIIFVNGDIVGYTTDPLRLVERMRSLRRSGSFELSASYNRHNQEVNIFTDAGRAMTPRLIVDPNTGTPYLQSHHIKQIINGEWNTKPGGVWYALLTEGYVEFIDSAEEETLLIAMFPSDLVDANGKYTHCELNPALMFGIGASLIPFPNHNQSPRNCYQAAMGKQAIGIPGINFAVQSKNKVTVLAYPQKPVVSSFTAEKIGYDIFPAGQNACVAIAQYQGFNVEDSIIMNLDSVQRGFMLIYEYVPFKTGAHPNKGEVFEIPDEEECFNFRGDPSKLDPETGIIRVGTDVEEGDILIGKTVASNEKDVEYRRKGKQNVSVVYDSKIPGRVHLVSEDKDCEGYPQIKVVIARRRPPIEGDKFSARHGQKGTVGLLVPAKDLPHTQEGITPDIVVNPLAIPSRMTIGMLLELLLGREVCTGNGIFNVPAREFFNSYDDHDDEVEDYDPTKHTLSGGDPTRKRSEIPEVAKLRNEFYDEGDSTPCRRDRKIGDIMNALRALGVNEFCDEVMYNGVTGQKMKGLIFFGVCYYQRLKHMVLDKIHARARGGHTGLTRQPREGRKAGGGFRIGCMESEVLLAHGGSWFVKDRLMEQSDETKMWYCKECGLQATVCTPEHAGGSLSVYECRVCERYDVALVKLPFATKLLIQEYMGMNIVMRIITSGAGEIGDDAYVYDGNEIVGKGIVVRY